MRKLLPNRIERESMTLWNGDGLADILIGFGLALAGILMLLGISHAMIAAWIPAAMYPWIKKRLTSSRMGQIKFRPSRPVRVVKNVAKTVVIFMITALLFLIVFQDGHPSVDAFLYLNLEFIIGSFLAVLVLIAGFITRTYRYIFYGSAMMILSVLSRIQLFSFYWIFIAVGSAAFLTGSIVFINFIRENPLVAPEDMNVQ